MRPAIAKVKNIENLVIAFEATRDRASGQPGMILVHGFTGAGKTTAISWFLKPSNGIYRRVGPTWTPGFMLDEIISEFSLKTNTRSSAGKVKAIAEHMKAIRRPLFIDEADYLFPPFSDYTAIEVLRYIHDESEVPIILIGMEGIETKIMARKQLDRRLYRRVEFRPIDLPDTRTLTDTICEVAVADDLVERVFQETRGSIAAITLAIANLEGYARQQNWKEINAQRWGDRATLPSGSFNGADRRRGNKGEKA